MVNQSSAYEAIVLYQQLLNLSRKPEELCWSNSAWVSPCKNKSRGYVWLSSIPGDTAVVPTFIWFFHTFSTVSKLLRAAD